MLLLRFVCSFAWADREVQPEECAFVRRLMERLAIGEEERRQVEAWLEEPPPPGSVDARLVPAERKARFVQALESVIAADGEVSPPEREALIAFARRLRA